MPGPTASAGRSSRSRRKSLIADLLPRVQAERGLTRQESLVREMLETSLRLLRDDTDLRDIKLLNAALRELRYAFKVFAPWAGVRKVSIFGSARTPPDAAAYRQAVEFARRIVEQEWMVITGAGPGIMRACQEGAGREQSFGVNIRLPYEQGANEFIHNDPKLVTFRYFFTRKLMFMKEASGVVLFPGGLGTQDEGYEALTLVQTGKAPPLPIVFLDAPRGTYWKSWQQYVHDHLLRRQLISPEDLSLFKVTTSVKEAIEELTGFYRVYHSSRYVGHHLVIRLSHRLPDALVRQLSTDFADVTTGGIEQRDALEEERFGEPDLNDLPRLVFEFQRMRFGRLRQLIDRINRDGGDG
jgi:uncharacterized protein (TIGR00730 family)